MPRAGRWFDADAFGGIEDYQAQDEGGQLSVVGPLQGRLVGVEQQVGDIAPGDLRRLFDQSERGVIHPGRAHCGAL